MSTVKRKELKNNSANKNIEKDTPVPPWIKHPEIQRYSIGWRMGYGEKHIVEWDNWANEISKNNLLEYFKKFSPIPIEWLDWVVNRLGYLTFADNPKDNIYSGVKWLEQQELANFAEFEKWYKQYWKE